MGIPQMAAAARTAGITAEVFPYEDFADIEVKVEAHRGFGYTIAGVGYSLGVSTLTYLQTRHQFDLVLCIAASQFGQNYAIVSSTKRSVLWRGPGPLSSAGGNLGFDVVHDVVADHLSMDLVTSVQVGVLRELQNLAR
jgi:hypothetical protein